MRLSTAFGALALPLLAQMLAAFAFEEESQMLRTHSLYVPFVGKYKVIITVTTWI
jgi:hypothetical protein